MKKIMTMAAAAVCAAMAVSCGNNAEQTTKHEGSMSVDEALAKRQSIRYYTAENKFSEKELLDLLWAANGVTREDGRRTAPSAVNAQDIDLYICTAHGYSTVCCAPRMDIDGLRAALSLPETSIPVLYHPVGQ